MNQQQLNEPLHESNAGQTLQDALGYFVHFVCDVDPKLTLGRLTQELHAERERLAKEFEWICRH